MAKYARYPWWDLTSQNLIGKTGYRICLWTYLKGTNHNWFPWWMMGFTFCPIISIGMRTGGCSPRGFPARRNWRVSFKKTAIRHKLVPKNHHSIWIILFSQHKSSNTNHPTIMQHKSSNNHPTIIQHKSSNNHPITIQQPWRTNEPFLVAFTWLYSPLCPSVGQLAVDGSFRNA